MYILYIYIYIYLSLSLCVCVCVCVCARKRRSSKKMKGGDARIELATSCTRSRNHTTRPITHNIAEMRRKKECTQEGNPMG